jgi:hypothetical protein
MPRTWLPFDEIFEHDLSYGRGWFNKAEYHRPGHELHRFGSEEFRSISQELTSLGIGRSRFYLEDEGHVNAILDFFGARLTSSNLFRPTADFRANR